MSGNIRDEAAIEQLIVLANLESLNAEFIRMGWEKEKRLLKLNETAIQQMQSLLGHQSIKKLET